MGTKEGGAKTRETNIRKYGKDYYANMGKTGGSFGAKDGVIKGFAKNPLLAKEAGRKGGRISKRKSATAQTANATAP